MSTRKGQQPELPVEITEVYMSVARAQQIQAQLIYDQLQNIHDAYLVEEDDS